MNIGIDGREIDEQIARLSGEAGHVKVKRPDEAQPVIGDPIEVARSAAPTTYYGQPLLKIPVWKAWIPSYFYVGGVAGASAVLGAVAERLDGHALRPLVVRARWLAAGSCVVGAGLLIADLGRPSRFLNMLRVLRPSSPMSVGSFVLAGSGATSFAAALLAHAPDGLRTVGNVSAHLAGLFGIPLTGYTAVLLSSTAVPLWKACRRTLPALFMASSLASAAALLELSPLPSRARRVVHRAGLLGKAAELAATVAVEREVAAREPYLARPLRRGGSSALFRGATALTAAGLVLSLIPSTRARRAGAIATTAGALAMRFAIYHAGRASARDPVATLVEQRALSSAAWTTRRESPSTKSAAASSAAIPSPSSTAAAPTPGPTPAI